MGPHETPYEFGFFEVGRYQAYHYISANNVMQFAIRFNKGRASPLLLYGSPRAQC